MLLMPLNDSSQIPNYFGRPCCPQRRKTTVIRRAFILKISLLLENTLRPEPPSIHMLDAFSQDKKEMQCIRFGPLFGDYGGWRNRICHGTAGFDNAFGRAASKAMTAFARRHRRLRNRHPGLWTGGRTGRILPGMNPDQNQIERLRRKIKPSGAHPAGRHVWRPVTGQFGAVLSAATGADRRRDAYRLRPVPPVMMDVRTQ
jgi:hypothetical protein